jgi:hypothetical protein
MQVDTLDLPTQVQNFLCHREYLRSPGGAYNTMVLQGGGVFWQEICCRMRDVRKQLNRK